MHASRHVGALLAAALTAAAVAVSVQGHVLLHRCVEAGGSWADTAIRLAVLRDAAGCPDGSLAVGAVPRGAVLLLSIALPVLAAHVLLAGVGLGLGAVALRGARVVTALLRGWVGVPVARALPVAPRVRLVVPGLVVPRPALALLVARPHRAPPLPA